MKSCSRKQLTQEYPFTWLPPEMPGQQGFEPGPTAQSRHPLERNADNWQKGQEGHNPAQQQQHSPEHGSLLNLEQLRWCYSECAATCGNTLMLINALTNIAFTGPLHGTEVLSAALLH